MAFDIPRDIMLPVDRIAVRLDPGPHPFERDNADAIAETWRQETAANPALFDGTVVLLASLGYRDRVLEGRCHAVGYSTFMHWRRARGGTAQHAFAHAMLVTADNALVAVRMAQHTANPGRVYFAAGSFEPEDFRDGLVDADYNMTREVREETGLDLSGARADDGYHAMSTERGTVIARRYFLTDSADEIAARIAAFVAAETQPEIAGPVVIRHPHDRPDGLMPHMRPLVEWHFGMPEDNQAAAPT